MSRRARRMRSARVLALLLAVAWPVGSLAQGFSPTPVAELPPPGAAVMAPASPAPAPVGTVTTPVIGTPAPGTATTAPIDAGRIVLPPEVQIVRFQGPAGVRVEVLGPAPQPVPAGDNHGLATFGLRLGVGYQLRLSNLPNRPGAVIYPYIEMVGHLHRPPEIDPAKYPIRVQFGEDDCDDVLTRGQMVTSVVFLESPDSAMPVHLPKDEIPVITLGPAEQPIHVAAALGRIMAIVRMGTKAPGPEDLTGATIFAGSNSLPMPRGVAPGSRCPIALPHGGHCSLPAGPGGGSSSGGMVPAPGEPWLPKDEFLCDGGDFKKPAHLTEYNDIVGIEPRDAAMLFKDVNRTRILPTNMVCIYAPRFSCVRSGLGVNEAFTVDKLRGTEIVQQHVIASAKTGPQRLVKNQTAEIERHRSRASGLVAREGIGRNIEVRVLHESDNVDHVAGHVKVLAPEHRESRVKPGAVNTPVRLVVQKSAEGTVVTGIVQGAGEKVMAWKPQEVASSETPPNRTGLRVVKQVNVSEAEPGDIVTYTISYCNMGNVPITAVSIVDNLLPRLEYVKDSAHGPEGAVFTAADNHVGSEELRWDIGTIEPGKEGVVSFQAKVR